MLVKIFYFMYKLISMACINGDVILQLVPERWEGVEKWLGADCMSGRWYTSLPGGGQHGGMLSQKILENECSETHSGTL